MGQREEGSWGKGIRLCRGCVCRSTSRRHSLPGGAFGDRRHYRSQWQKRKQKKESTDLRRLWNWPGLEKALTTGETDDKWEEVLKKDVTVSNEKKNFKLGDFFELEVLSVGTRLLSWCFSRVSRQSRVKTSTEGKMKPCVYCLARSG